MAEQDDGFLARWARRKTQVRRGEVPVEPAPTAAARVPAPASGAAVPPYAKAVPGGAAGTTATASPVAMPSTAAPDALPTSDTEAPPPPTLDEARALTPDADFRRFVAPEVGADVRNTALKQLWADPHFNVMDGLDIYIDDYSRPDPLPAGMLRKLAQSAYLNLFDDEKPPPAATPAADPAPPTPAAPPPELPSDPDEDPAVRLQSHDEPGPAGAGDGAGEGSGHQR